MLQYRSGGVDGIGDGTLKSDWPIVVLHHIGLGITIRFQAAVSDTSSGKLPESLCQLVSDAGVCSV